MLTRAISCEGKKDSTALQRKLILLRLKKLLSKEREKKNVLIHYQKGHFWLTTSTFFSRYSDKLE